MPDTVTVPKVLKGEAAEIWRTEFLRAYDDQCAQKSEDDRDACSAAMAWSKVKNTYKKGSSGEWVRKSDTSIFSIPLLARADNDLGPAQVAEQYPNPLGGNIPVPARLDGEEKELWEKAFKFALTADCAGASNPRDCAIRYAWEQVRKSYPDADTSAETTDRSLLDIFRNIIRGGPGSGHAGHAALKERKKGRTTRSRRRYFNKAKREDLAVRGWALPWGGYPIEDFGDLKRAIQAIGRAKDRTRTIAHIIKNAKRLGRERVVPRAWWAEVGMELATRSLVLGRRTEYMDELIERREFAQGRRKELAGEGKALPWGGFPIENCGDVKNAVQAIGRAKDRSRTIAHIKRHAGRLNCTGHIPKKWGDAEAKAEDIQVIFVGNTLLTEMDVERRFAQREMAEISDQETLASFGYDAPARRPEGFDSNEWSKLPLELRTLGAVIWRRHCERTYIEALENAVINGWIAEQSPTREDEYVFKHWRQTPEGMLMARAVLVRKSGSDEWYLREVGRGASMSFAIKVASDEIRLSHPPRVEG